MYGGMSVYGFSSLTGALCVTGQYWWRCGVGGEVVVILRRGRMRKRERERETERQTDRGVNEGGREGEKKREREGERKETEREGERANL